MMNSLNSPLLDNAVAELAKLPGIGRKTALRLALHLLRQDKDIALSLGKSIIEMRENIRYCKRCHNISEEELCPFCSDSRRDSKTVCVVENVKDVLTVESTHEHHGLYHVLGGLISPLDGVSPSDLEIDSLVKRVKEEGIEEIILALSPTMEGDTTNFYIYRKLADLPVRITMLARGLAIGNELEYADELTLGRSILNRTLFSDTFHE
ncbi:MAG: recombination protein RecR [Bacteroidales bacterium]|nr:recombination protein RecR [Bacteroidales bacterium]MBD5272803.1 recombination protein RecR [Bacteroides sp.]MBD5274298.1 recombination protein RecR [Bacteroides sp.]MDE6258584.1 recombination mediator RecR [Muribaculaceae bacterium]